MAGRSHLRWLSGLHPPTWPATGLIASYLTKKVHIHAGIVHSLRRERAQWGLVDTPCCYGLRVNPWKVPTLVDIPVIRAERGAVGVVENDVPFPFELKRVYYLFDVPSNAVRGSHAHKSLNQLIIAISGSFRVDLQDRTTRSQFLLSSPDIGLTVPPGYWRTLSDFSAGSAALVFASAEYDPEDYIRDFAEFQAWAT